MPKRRKTVPHENPATPQTRAKLKRGTLAYMIETNKISSVGAEMQAAEEINKTYLYLTSAVLPSQGSMERIDGGRSANDPAWFADAYQKHYKPWASKETRTALDITISVVVDQLTANDMDKRYRWRKGTSGKILLWSLRRYALNAGWVSGRLAQVWNETMDNAQQAA